MLTRPNGFSMVELVIVIVVLGILGSMALPEFGDIGTQAGSASAQSVASSMVVAAANNRVMCELGEAATTVAACTDMTTLVSNVVWTDYVVSVGGTAPAGYLNCTVLSTTGGVASTVTLRSTTVPCG